jgi:hypothetical protein
VIRALRKGLEAQGGGKEGADSIYRICVPFPFSTSLGEFQLLFADIPDSAPAVYLILCQILVLLFPVDDPFKILNKRLRNVQVVSGAA